MVDGEGRKKDARATPVARPFLFRLPNAGVQVPRGNQRITTWIFSSVVGAHPPFPPQTSQTARKGAINADSSQNGNDILS